MTDAGEVGVVKKKQRRPESCERERKGVLRKAF